MTSRHARGGLGVRLASLLMAAAALGETPAPSQIQAIRVPAGSALGDPDAAVWREAPETTVTLLPQTMALPMHLAPAVSALTVQAVHDGRTLAVHLVWRDASKSDRLTVGEFGDQVAIEFPYEFKKDALPSPMMGHTGAPVKIWQWRAAFQADIDRGRALEIKDIYPHAHFDVYPDEILKATDARPYLGAIGVDNLITRATTSPVLEQVAEGWGTLTIQPDDQQANGKGVWRDGVWSVVVAHPLRASDSDVRFTPGGETAAAFAVWDGGSHEVGPRKSWAPWVPLVLAP